MNNSNSNEIPEALARIEHRFSRKEVNLSRTCFLVELHITQKKKYVEHKLA
jgi:hypothetical protein